VFNPPYLLGGFPDPSRSQQSTRPPGQKKWLVEKFELYKKHHATKTLTQFFPSLYEEYFLSWPPTPTEEDIKAAKGNAAVALVKVQQEEQKVRDFNSPEE